jgi:hypothetical protein
MEFQTVPPQDADFLVISRPPVGTSEEWFALGRQAMAAGLAVRFGKTVNAPQEQNRQPVYASSQDVLEVVTADRSTRLMGVRVWKGLVAIAVEAHNRDAVIPLRFGRHPSLDRLWDAEADFPYFGNLDVNSLAAYTEDIRAQTRGMRRFQLENTLASILPQGIGRSSLIIWERIVEKMLAQPEPPAAQ